MLYGDCDVEFCDGPSVYDVKIWVKGGSSCDGKEKVTVIIAKNACKAAKLTRFS